MFLIFTDLDRCLLDENYSFDMTIGVLREVCRRGHEVIINTSKTRSEVEHLLRTSRISLPYIVENGSAIFGPDGKKTLELGRPYVEVLAGMEIVRTYLGPVKSFSSLSVEELAEITGLDKKGAELAKKRDYSEPFIYTGTIPEELHQELGRKKFRLIRGGKFHHLLGMTDKGEATAKVIESLKQQVLSSLIVGIGDGPNDLSMFDEVDIPFMTQRGPSGWCDFVLRLLEMNYG